MSAADADASLRLDKWLWHARFFKTRSLAARAVTGDGVRINSLKVTKPSASVKPDDVLTFIKENDVKVVRVLGLGQRRGPASEARTLYEDLSDPPAPREPNAPSRPRGAGRPTKADRRALDKLMR